MSSSILYCLIARDRTTILTDNSLVAGNIEIVTQNLLANLQVLPRVSIAYKDEYISIMGLHS